MSIRVMTYNVRYFAHVARIPGLHSSARGIGRVADALAGLAEQPHVICLQEVETRSMRSGPSHDSGVPGQTQLEALMAALDASLARQGRPHRYRGYYFPAHEYRFGTAKIYTTGLAILARTDLRVDSNHGHDPHDITHRRFRLTARLKQSRVCAHLRVIDDAGRSYDIFNTHLSLPAFLTTKLFTGPGRMGWGENQVAEVDALATFVERRASSDGFVLVGDFNSLPGSPVYRRLADRLAVRDAFAEVTGLTPEALRTHWPTCGFLNLRMRVDHLFAGAGLSAADGVGNHPFGDPRGHFHGLSDHVPIALLLERSGAKGHASAAAGSAVEA